MYRLVEQAGLPEPSRDSAYGDFFRKPKNETEALSIALSALFKQNTIDLVKVMRDSGEYSPAAMQDLSKRHVEQVVRASTKADEVMETVITDEYQERSRIRLQRLLAPQILLLPFLHAYPRSSDEARHRREELIEPMYRTLVGYASDLHEEMQSLDPLSEAGKSAKGAITEIVALGIGNRSRSLESCYIPSLYVSNRTGIDIHQFRYSKNRANSPALYTGIQIKHRVSDAEQRPGLSTITGSDLGVRSNSKPWRAGETFTTVRAMQYDVGGQADVVLGKCAVEPGLQNITYNLARITNPTLIDYPDIRFI